MIGWVVAVVAIVCAGVAVMAALRARRDARDATARLERREAEVARVAASRTVAVEPAAAVVERASPDADDHSDDALATRLRQAVDRLEHGVVIWDVDGQELFRNQAAVSLAEARDGHVLVAAAVEELLVDALAGRHVRRVVELFGPPAEAFVVSASPIGAGGGDGALAVVEDRSLQRRTETVRRDFVANISHELKTPIGALGLLAETLRDEPDRDVVERLASRMIVEAERVSSTVDDLLELSRIEFGDDTEFGNVPVTAAVSEAVGRIASAAEQAGIDVRVDVPATVAVDGDQRQLVSALFNLLDNAVKYSTAGSEVRIEAIDDPGDGVVRMYISDQGIGVPRRDLDRIFERFYRVDRARSRDTGGTGLGLAIVRHVASNHGGDVLVDSTEGVGTTFTLILPRADGAVVPAGSSVLSGTGPGLDDEDLMIESLEMESR